VEVEEWEEEADDDAEKAEAVEGGWEWEADGWDRGGGGMVAGEGADLLDGSRLAMGGGGGGELA